MFEREIKNTILSALNALPVLVLTGPRQSGKTTLLKSLFPDFEYLNLEAPDILLAIQSDPRGFFRDRHKNWIIDEAQRFPELFSYIQVFVDDPEYHSKFILSGSQNFLLLERVTQSLAGRSHIFELLPLSYRELLSDPFEKIEEMWEILFRGGYPRPYHQKLNVNHWFQNYIQTYVERDIRSLINVKDLLKFQLFLKLCAGRHGQLLNLNALAQECGTSQPTIQNWISILEASYIIYRLPPYYQNYNKRLVKTPKLYFYDSGLVSHLLGIESAEHLAIHASRGAIFEGFVLSELLKSFYAKGIKKQLYFWRDHIGKEIDCLIETSEGLDLIEIKSSMTFHPDFVKMLHSFTHSIQTKIKDSILIYAGKETSDFQGVRRFSWNEIANHAIT